MFYSRLEIKERKGVRKFIIYYAPGCKYHPGYKSTDIKYYSNILLNTEGIWVEFDKLIDVETHKPMLFDDEQSALAWIKNNDMEYPLITSTLVEG